MLKYFKTDWFHNKNIIITGCSTGIGRELTRHFIEKYGCKVLGIARTESKLSALKAELGENFLYYPRRWTTTLGNALHKRNSHEFKPDILIKPDNPSLYGLSI